MHPILLHLGPLTIPTFGLLAALGIMAALALSLRTARAVGLPPDSVWNAGLFAVAAAFVLSRLLLVLTNFASFRLYPVLLLSVPSLTPTGLLLTAVATLGWLRLCRLHILSTLDAWAPCATLLWAFLSLGHFAEGSDPGLPTRSRLGLRLPGESIPAHPVALYATLAALAITAFLLWEVRRRHSSGSTTALALALTGITQFFLTFLRQPFPYADVNPLPLDPLQWVALGMIAVSGLLTLSHPAPRRPEVRSTHAV